MSQVLSLELKQVLYAYIRMHVYVWYTYYCMCIHLYMSLIEIDRFDHRLMIQ